MIIDESQGSMAAHLRCGGIQLLMRYINFLLVGDKVHNQFFVHFDSHSVA